MVLHHFNTSRLAHRCIELLTSCSLRASSSLPIYSPSVVSLGNTDRAIFKSWTVGGVAAISTWSNLRPIVESSWQRRGATAWHCLMVLLKSGIQVMKTRGHSTHNQPQARCGGDTTRRATVLPLQIVPASDAPLSPCEVVSIPRSECSNNPNRLV